MCSSKRRNGKEGGHEEVGYVMSCGKEKLHRIIGPKVSRKKKTLTRMEMGGGNKEWCSKSC